MKLKISPQLVIRILFLSSVFICIFDILGLDDIVSFLYFFMFPFVIGLTGLVLSTAHYKTFDFMVFFTLVMLAFINPMIGMLLTEQETSLLDFKKTLIFLMTISFLFVSNNVQLDEKTKKFIDTTIFISSVFIIALYFGKNNEIYDYTNLGIKYLYFNFSNPNFASMYLLVYGMYNLILSWKLKKTVLKIICFGLAMFMFFAVIETLSRNTMLISVFFVVMFCYVKYKKRISLFYTRAVSLLVSIWPLLFAFLYFSIINYFNQMKFLSFLDMDKGFGTRIDVWTSVFEKLSKSLFIGDFSFAILRQAHNSHLDIWISYGFIPLCLTSLFIFLIVHNDGKEYTNRLSYLYMIGFICCIFIGMAEAALFSGCQGLFIMIGMYILFSKSENGERCFLLNNEYS